MRSARLPLIAAQLTLVLASAFALPASAAPAMSIGIDEMLPMAPEFKKSLNLNSNQQLLWQQVETKTRAALRARQTRREALQATLTKDLADPRLELREVAKRYDAEASLSLLEDQQLRELWLTMNDALDDTQRAQVVAFFAEQLQRDFHGEPPKHSEGERKRPEGGGKRGGPGGMGGMGKNGGSINVN